MPYHYAAVAPVADRVRVGTVIEEVFAPTVTALDAKVGAPEVEVVIAGADVVFGCLDRDLPRLQLTELCARYAKPLFDLASDTGGGEQSDLDAVVELELLERA
jgi:hypothetical protein